MLHRLNGGSAPVHLTLLILLLAVAAAAGTSFTANEPTGPGGPPKLTLPAEQALANLRQYPWAFLRDGQEVDAGERAATVILVGDIQLGRGVSIEMNPWSDVSGWLNAADITLGNLEGVLTWEAEAVAAPQTSSQPIILAAEPVKAFPMSQAGLDILSVANNHALDYGPNGLAETAAALHDAGMVALGMIGGESTSRTVVREFNGVRLAFLAFNAVPDPDFAKKCPGPDSFWLHPAAWETAASVKAIEEAKAVADGVIVIVHWGFEYETRSDPYQESIAQKMLVAGADLVVGHHPHTAQPIAVNGSQVVAYSLGNFVFDQGVGDTGSGVALRGVFDTDGLRALQVLPVKAGPRPRLLDLDEAGPLLARVLPEPGHIAFACDGSGCAEVEGPRPRHTGLFHAGQIDMTGDGLAETVRREGSQIIIYEEGEVVWRSPESWRVVDAALGDPNDDGRYEIMMAIWRKDEAGYERSQPYIVGYRGGEYALMWGGRPVVDPIQELEVGDVDGDGVDELVVIEELADGSAQAVSLWRWTGWTFTLGWRSEYGRYWRLGVGDWGLAVDRLEKTPAWRRLRLEKSPAWGR